MSDELECQPQAKHLRDGKAAHPEQSVPASSAHRAPVQAWRAWSGCGDGRPVYLIIDPRAREVWLLPARDAARDSRSH